MKNLKLILLLNAIFMLNGILIASDANQFTKINTKANPLAALKARLKTKGNQLPKDIKEVVNEYETALFKNKQTRASVLDDQLFNLSIENPNLSKAIESAQMKAKENASARALSGEKGGESYAEHLQSLKAHYKKGVAEGYAKQELANLKAQEELARLQNKTVASKTAKPEIKSNVSANEDIDVQIDENRNALEDMGL
ncbi:MAG: hypothetical protein P4L22_04980 [Candidatus Babeliales bacterium]|nr:hypothetical protein [Candidatus Babeliales bacterium]